MGSPHIPRRRLMSQPFWSMLSNMRVVHFPSAVLARMAQL